MRAATITAKLAPGYTLGEALDGHERSRQARAAAQRANGSDRPVARIPRFVGREIYFDFLLALGFIYLVLAAQFESFVDPFIIMLTVPLSMTGALLALRMTGSTLNIYSQIGLITLVGLITKHGILIVEFSNQLRDQGENREAVKEAAVLRLRPILMTTGAMVLGAVPLAVRSARALRSATDWLGDRRWHVAWHLPHAVRGADRLHAARQWLDRGKPQPAHAHGAAVVQGPAQREP